VNNPMFCPNCGTQVTETLKFCKLCGANLLGVREAMTRTGGEKFHFSKTRAADLLLSEEERERKRAARAEEKRYQEIKGGIVTAVVGLGAMIFLRLLMPAIAQNEPHDAELLLRVWVVGLVPLMVGLSIIFNGVFLSKRMIQARQRQSAESGATGELAGPREVGAMANPSALSPPDFSVIEPTTRRIPDPVGVRGGGEPN
jgi:hypothetical protein